MRCAVETCLSNEADSFSGVCDHHALHLASVGTAQMNEKLARIVELLERADASRLDADKMAQGLATQFGMMFGGPNPFDSIVRGAAGEPCPKCKVTVRPCLCQPEAA